MMPTREIGPSPVDQLVGTEGVSDDPDGAMARVEVREELLQPIGLVHGGVLSTVVDSVCSRATAVALLEQGMAAMAQSLNVSFLRPITPGTIEVSAVARHRGRTTWLWDAEVTDAEGRLCALARATIAVRPLPEGA